MADGDPDEAMMLVQRHWRAQVPAHVSPRGRPAEQMGRIEILFFLTEIRNAHTGPGLQLYGAVAVRCSVNQNSVVAVQFNDTGRIGK